MFFSLWGHCLRLSVGIVLNRKSLGQRIQVVQKRTGIATNLAFRDNPFGQEVRGAPSFGWGLRPRSGMYLLNVYSVFKVHEGDCFVPHLVGNENGQKLTPSKKFFRFF